MDWQDFTLSQWDTFTLDDWSGFTLDPTASKNFRLVIGDTYSAGAVNCDTNLVGSKIGSIYSIGASLGVVAL